MVSWITKGVMGLFVTIEGIEGSGKSTLRSLLSTQLQELEPELVVTREPGATSLGQSIRALLLNPENTSIDPRSEVLLFLADRAQHLTEVIEPALARKALVLCDRYIHSTIAYQGYGRGLDLSQLEYLTEFSTAGRLPNLVLLLDISPEKGLERAKERAERATGSFKINRNEGSIEFAESGWTRFEQAELSFHERIRKGFLSMAQSDPERFLVLDARLPPEELARISFERILQLLAKQRE